MEDTPSTDDTALTSCAALSISSVSANTYESMNPPNNVRDGKLSTRWSGMGPGAYLTADLGSVNTICAVKVAWYQGASRINTFSISVSKDGKSFTTAFNGKSSGTSTALQRYSIPNLAARYVRLTVQSNTVNNWASVTELQVTGYPVTATDPPAPTPTPGGNDKFGIKKLYSTAPGGREWFMNADNLNDGIFNPRVDVSRTSLTRNSDGSWRVNSGEVRMAVTTPSGQKPWRNVEVTGHYRIVTPGSSSDCLQTYARGDVHNDPTPCRGSAIKGRLHFNGRMGFIKELYHKDNNSGYTNEIAMATGTTTSIVGRWVGFKVVFYNVSGGVKMESYLDDNLNNDWKKVTEYLDNGNWSVSNLTAFNNYGNSCVNKDTGISPLKRNEVITWAGDWVSFRSDYTTYDFKNLSVREILP